jgi:hypothetical protein
MTNEKKVDRDGGMSPMPPGQCHCLTLTDVFATKCLLDGYDAGDHSPEKTSSAGPVI